MTDSEPNAADARKGKRVRSRAEFDATVADIESQVRATNAKIEAQVRATNAKIEHMYTITAGSRYGVVIYTRCGVCMTADSDRLTRTDILHYRIIWQCDETESKYNYTITMRGRNSIIISTLLFPVFTKYQHTIPFTN